MALWVSFVTLFVLLPAIQSQDVIDGVWTDDFEHDDSSLTGWYIWNKKTGDVGNPIIQGETYKFHGPFNAVNLTMWEYKRFYLDRYFSCSTRSMVSISFYYAFCLSAEANDYVQVGLDDTYSPEYNMKRDLFTGTKLEEIDAGETYRRDLPDTVSSYCDAKGDWWYKTVSDYSA
eukprot:233212_1